MWRGVGGNLRLDLKCGGEKWGGIRSDQKMWGGISPPSPPYGGDLSHTDCIGTSGGAEMIYTFLAKHGMGSTVRGGTVTSRAPGRCVSAIDKI